MLLPAKPATGTDDTRGVLGELVEADADAGRILACTIYARSGARADPIYVHAKVGIVDDAWITIGSAQLARREAGLPLTHRLVRLPHVSKRSGRALGPLSGLLVDG